MQLEEFKKKKAAAQASKRATPLTTPHITPVPTPLKAPEPASRSRTPAVPTTRPQQDGSQAAATVSNREPVSRNGLIEQGQPPKAQQPPVKITAAPPSEEVQAASPKESARATAALPASSTNAVAPELGSKHAAGPVGRENGNVQLSNAAGQRDAALEKQVADLKAELSSEQQRHATEVQELKEALQERDAALSSQSADAHRAAEEVQGLLQEREGEVRQLHAQMTNLQSSVNQQATAALDWQSSKARLEEQVGLSPETASLPSLALLPPNQWSKCFETPA